MVMEMKGIGSTLLRVVRRVIEANHDDTGWIESNGKRFVILTTAITANSTTTSLPAGTIGFTTHATGKSQIFVSDGAHWQLLLRASSVMCGQAYLGAVPAATTTGAITQKSLSGISNGDTASIIAQPKTPRNVKVTITDGNSSISAYSLTIAGKAPDGTTISETFTFADGLTPTGSKIFASITSVTWNSGTGNGASDTLDLGYGSKLGVPVPYGAQGLVITSLLSNGTIEAASATDQTNNSFTPTTAPDGAKLFFVWFGYTFPA